MGSDDFQSTRGGEQERVVGEGHAQGREGMEVLHPVGGGVAGVFGDRPAVLAWSVGQQPAHERPGVPAGLHPAEPAQQLLRQLLPPSRVYAVARIARNPMRRTNHPNTIKPKPWGLLPGQPGKTIYGWSPSVLAGSIAAMPTMSHNRS
jgi:hypothetical protein